MSQNHKIGHSFRQHTGKPVLPAPTFKDASSTHVILGFAKSVKRPFSVQDVRNFTARYTNDRDVVRSLEVLEKNGSVAKCNETTWQITPKGIQHIYDFVMRRKPNDNLKP
jgi:hypothetical protein